MLPPISPPALIPPIPESHLGAVGALLFPELSRCTVTLKNQSVACRGPTAGSWEHWGPSC